MTTETRKKFNISVFKDNITLTLLAAPVIVYLFVFCYLPMGGLVLAFKDFSYDRGIFGSPWNNFKNFEFFFSSMNAWRITRNTLGYGLAFIAVSITCAVIIALLLFEIKSSLAVKVYQTAYTIPRFLSWVIVSYITYIFLSPNQGVINHMITFFGGDPVYWFNNAGYWPLIIVIVDTWKNVGLNSVMYYAALMGIDGELFEAAKIDGANRLQRTLYISVPAVVPVMTIVCILALSNIFRGDFGLFYQIPRDVGILYPTTDIIDTYVYRGLRSGDFGAATAVGFFQSVVGMCAVFAANAVVRKISPQNKLY